MSTVNVFFVPFLHAALKAQWLVVKGTNLVLKRVVLYSLDDAEKYL